MVDLLSQDAALVNNSLRFICPALWMFHTGKFLFQQVVGHWNHKARLAWSGNRGWPIVISGKLVILILLVLFFPSIAYHITCIVHSSLILVREARCLYLPVAFDALELPIDAMMFKEFMQIWCVKWQRMILTASYSVFHTHCIMFSPFHATIYDVKVCHGMCPRN